MIEKKGYTHLLLKNFALIYNKLKYNANNNNKSSNKKPHYPCDEIMYARVCVCICSASVCVCVLSMYIYMHAYTY